MDNRMLFFQMGEPVLSKRVQLETQEKEKEVGINGSRSKQSNRTIHGGKHQDI